MPHSRAPLALMLVWIALFVAFVAAAVIAVVFFMHWKEIRLLDPDTIQAEQERKKHEYEVMRRLDVRLRQAAVPFQRWGRTLRRAYRRAEERLMRASGIDKAVSSDTSPVVQSLLKSAVVATENGEFAEAERVYLEILKQDRHQFQAYRGLGELYMRQRAWPQAKETFLFLERIRGCDDACYANLASIARQEGKVADAERWQKRSVEVAPRNAERHKELAELYMANGAADYAWVAARRASELDPTNPRVLELSVRAAILVRDREEAERRYEQLRPLTRDRQLLQLLREQIDGILAT